MDLPILSISQVGHCALTQSALRLNKLQPEQPNEYLKLAAREGRRHEAFIKEDLPEHGWQSTSLGREVHCGPCNRDGYHIRFDDDAFSLVGHMDDLVHPLGHYSDIHLGEYKSMSVYQIPKLMRLGMTAHRTYATQVSLYHYITGLPILYVIKNRNSGEMDVIEMDPPYAWEDIIERLYMIEEHVVRGDLAPCDVKPDQIDNWSCTDLCTVSQLEQSLGKH